MASSSAFNNYIVDSAMGPTCSRQVPPGSFGVPAARGHGTTRLHTSYKGPGSRQRASHLPPNPRTNTTTATTSQVQNVHHRLQHLSAAAAARPTSSTFQKCEYAQLKGHICPDFQISEDPSRSKTYDLLACMAHS
ncbi:predicted protein [Chaetomium globosum CBS 148.51]|uniref:Uncharacterized protein n=1 Tax=Chaetomium globosum (strain ATCC 6205 / CBS 148.51 / DSM 1962 / NBRC 6347 / NRRL 1970) TaxID=306901 RepID=Q2GQE6_CHAGB|nr:uncharacterized protein CHGG_09808 [Chaetomium globosum CBS 148.51]EAQ83404.1 predicted protein [Chaetomium globosum CBS 148.51]